MNKSEIEENRSRWEFALGLSKIDGYEPTKEHLELIERNIKGEMTEDEMLKYVIKKYDNN